MRINCELTNIPQIKFSNKLTIKRMSREKQEAIIKKHETHAETKIQRVYQEYLDQIRHDHPKTFEHFIKVIDKRFKAV